MKDMLMIIYNALIENELIANVVTKNQIKFYELPETMSFDTPVVIIDPLDVPSPAYYASNMELSTRLTYQIDVQHSDRKQVKIVQNEIKKVMQVLGFYQLSDGMDEYFKETKRYVDARRYRMNTKMYDINY